LTPHFGPPWVNNANSGVDVSGRLRVTAHNVETVSSPNYVNMFACSPLIQFGFGPTGHRWENTDVIKSASLCIALTSLALFPNLGYCQSARETIKKTTDHIVFEGDLLANEVDAFDMTCARRLLMRDDRDHDHVLGMDELQNVKFLASLGQLDLNHNDRLTLMELAIYFANARNALSIDFSCCNNAYQLVEPHDRNADQSISETEYRSIPCSLTFQELDWDQDGQIDPFEFAKWLASDMAEHGIHPNDHVLAIESVGRFDQNADDTLSSDEQSLGDWPTAQPRQVSDADDNLNSFEIAKLFTEFKQRTGVDSLAQEAALKVIDRFDKNDDGRLDGKEFKNGRYTPEVWESFDFNRDEHLSWYEIAERYFMNRLDRGTTIADIKKAEQLLQRYDRNADTLVDMNEALESRADIGIITIEEITRFDGDANGSLSKLELSEFFSDQRRQKEATK
tara:strand:- start:324110 stop:325462 length:1353 start_codon:yes stop_codon:yes gene_type:complete